ncbi:MAG: N-acetyl sugar amidotransferase [Daejeonella sp.]
MNSTINSKHYQICKNCIMDTSDSSIVFDEKGICDYCNNFYNNILPNWHPDDASEAEIMKVVEKIKEEGKNKDHDCLIGISGGLDSSYLAYIAKEKFGLRPLLFHVDAGWNSDISTHNIHKLVEGLDLELYTEVVNWNEMKDLQRAFIKSQVPDIDTPQDLVFFSSLYNFAVKHKYRYILTGGNFSTECVREPLEWGAYYQTDMRYVRDIHDQFGEIPLKTFPTCDIFKYKIQYRLLNGVRVVKPLDSVPFMKEDAIQTLEDKFGWQRYQHKHHESRFTRFYESYWLPRKFGFDKRKNHLSSLILTGQLTREAALERVSKPELPEQELLAEFEYVAKKLDFTVDELRDYFEGSNKTFKDYKNNYKLITLGTRVLQFLGVEKRAFK